MLPLSITFLKRVLIKKILVLAIVGLFAISITSCSNGSTLGKKVENVADVNEFRIY